jgi:hypothetical protein
LLYSCKKLYFIDIRLEKRFFFPNCHASITSVFGKRMSSKKEIMGWNKKHESTNWISIRTNFSYEIFVPITVLSHIFIHQDVELCINMNALKIWYDIVILSTILKFIML